MKTDLFNQMEIELGAPIKIENGKLQLLASHEVQVFAETQGVEALVGSGKDIRANFSQETVITVQSDYKKCRAFICDRARKPVKYELEVLSNSDRRPLESPTVTAIKSELRKHKLAVREQLQQIRLDGFEVKRQRAEIRGELDALKDAKSDEIDPEWDDPAVAEKEARRQEKAEKRKAERRAAAETDVVADDQDAE